MHIILGLLTTIASILWAVSRIRDSGFSFSSLNPFHWLRRRNWQNKLQTKGMHQLKHPMEAASLLIVANAQLDGTITKETKETILSLFTSEFGISQESANQYYLSSCHLLKEAGDIQSEVKHVLSPSINDFKKEHIDSLLVMLNKVATIDGQANSEQLDLITKIKNSFSEQESPSWG